MAAAAYWRCPICLRRVPDKIAECYCGRTRQPGDGPDEADQPKPFPLVPLARGAGLLAIAALALWATWPTRPPATSQGTPAPPGEATAPSGPISTSREPSALPAPTTTTLPGPALAFDVATRHIQHRLGALVARLDQFEKICGPGSRHSSCDPMRDQIAQEARDIRATYDAVEERARQEFVDAGTLMELRQRNGATEADVRAVLSRAEAATAGR